MRAGYAGAAGRFVECLYLNSEAFIHYFGYYLFKFYFYCYYAYWETWR